MGVEDASGGVSHTYRGKGPMSVVCGACRCHYHAGKVDCPECGGIA